MVSVVLTKGKGGNENLAATRLGRGRLLCAYSKDCFKEDWVFEVVLNTLWPRGELSCSVVVFHYLAP